MTFDWSNLRASQRLMPETLSLEEDAERRREIELLERLDREMEERAEEWKQSTGKLWKERSKRVADALNALNEIPAEKSAVISEDAEIAEDDDVFI